MASKSDNKILLLSCLWNLAEILYTDICSRISFKLVIFLEASRFFGSVFQLDFFCCIVCHEIKCTCHPLKTNMIEHQNIPLSPAVRVPFCCSWSEDDRISVITSKGIHIFVSYNLKTSYKLPCYNIYSNICFLSDVSDILAHTKDNYLLWIDVNVNQT